ALCAAYVMWRWMATRSEGIRRNPPRNGTSPTALERSISGVACRSSSAKPVGWSPSSTGSRPRTQGRGHRPAVEDEDLVGLLTVAVEVAAVEMPSLESVELPHKVVTGWLGEIEGV